MFSLAASRGGRCGDLAVSDRVTYVNGAVFPVHGGMTRSWRLVYRLVHLWRWLALRLARQFLRQRRPLWQSEALNTRRRGKYTRAPA